LLFKNIGNINFWQGRIAVNISKNVVEASDQIRNLKHKKKRTPQKMFIIKVGKRRIGARLIIATNIGTTLGDGLMWFNWNDGKHSESIPINDLKQINLIDSAEVAQRFNIVATGVVDLMRQYAKLIKSKKN